MNAIEAGGLRKSYRGREALSGVDLRVGEGEIYGLLGPNGAGKSTLVRLLTTLSRPDAGWARVAGRDVLREAAAVRRRIGYVPQGIGVDREATGRENLLLQGRIHHLPGRVLARRTEEILTAMGLTEAADRLVKGYSGGMKRRLDIALALLPEPPVLFLDEPTVGLDPESRAELWEHLRAVRDDRSLTVLFTTHYLEEAESLGDRVGIMDRGRMVVEGHPAELRRSLPDILRLRVADGAGEEILAEFGEVRWESGWWRLEAAGASLILPEVQRRLEAGGHRVLEATLERPDLSTVYFAHTGRPFTESDMAVPE